MILANKWHSKRVKWREREKARERKKKKKSEIATNNVWNQSRYFAHISRIIIIKTFVSWLLKSEYECLFMFKHDCRTSHIKRGIVFPCQQYRHKYKYAQTMNEGIFHPKHFIPFPIWCSVSFLSFIFIFHFYR